MFRKTARRWLGASMLLGLLCSMVAAGRKPGEVTRRQRERILMDPIINLGHDVPTPEELSSGHPHDDGYENGGVVHCVSSPDSLSGTNPKFNCFLASADPGSYLLDDGSLRIEEIQEREVIRGDFYDRAGRLQSEVYLDREEAAFVDRNGVPRTDIRPRQIKVKYNDDNTLTYEPGWSQRTLHERIANSQVPPFRKARDPYTEAAATSLFWALGYPVDRSDSMEAVVCHGCDGRSLVAIDAMIDNYYPGVRLFAEGKSEEQGWSTKEIQRGPYRSWSPQQKAYFDGLVLLATVIHHKSNRSRQNNLLCTNWQQGRCLSRATMLVHDLGSVFGAPSAKGRIEAWKSRDVWASPEDPGDCTVGLNWKDGGGHLEVGDAGRRFIIDKFASLGDEHLYAIFRRAKFQRVDGQLRLRTLQRLFPEKVRQGETTRVESYLDEVFTGGSGDSKLAKVFAVLARLEARLSPEERQQLDRTVLQSWVSVLRSKVRELETKRCHT